MDYIKRPVIDYDGKVYKNKKQEYGGRFLDIEDSGVDRFILQRIGIKKFETGNGRIVSREEAKSIAYWAGQATNTRGLLKDDELRPRGTYERGEPDGFSH